MRLAVPARLAVRVLAFAVVAGLAYALVPASGGAVEDPLARPVLVAPPNGAQVAAGTAVTFRIQTSPEESHSLWLHVSRSLVTDAEGVIGHDADIEPFSPVPGQSGVFEAAPPYHAYPDFWMNTPGTYYWQAFRIHCYDAAGPPDCEVESAVGTLVIVPRPVTARIIGVGPPRACRIAGDRVHVTATGFRPGAAVDLRFDARPAGSATADPFGNIDAPATVPSPGYGPVQRRFRLSATERDFAANTASIDVMAANLAYTVTPSHFTRRGQKVLFRFSGMVAGRPVFAHYRLGGRTRANVRMGTAEQPCGRLTVRTAMIPAGIVRSGTWTVQFDPLRRYSPRTQPRLRGTIVVRTFPR